MRTSPDQQAAEKPQPAGLSRRLLAMLYDALLVAAVLMLLTAGLLGFTGPEGLYPAPWWYPLLLLGAWYLFFAWFWRHGGATLGMQAWGLHLQTLDGGPVSRKATLLRFFGALLSAACGGLGYWWSLWDPHGATWHDRLSGTRIVRLPQRRR